MLASLPPLPRLATLAVPLGLAGCQGEPPVPQAGDAPTWWQDVRPIVAENCQGCHDGSSGAGLDLGSYEAARALAPLLLAKMEGDQDAPYVMPPWPAPDGAECSPPLPFRGDLRLADEDIATTRFREYFFDYIRRQTAEISIRHATHEDAQYPSESWLRNGSDPNTNEESQVTFVSALTSAALSLSSTGGFDYAWTTFGPVLENGKFFNARRK